MELRGTTILAVRHKGHVALIGDGQVTMGQSIVMKHTAKKVRRMYKDQIVAGFAGATADAFTLFERFDAHLEQTGGNLIRAAVELAKDWRSDKFLRKLEAMLLVADKDHTLVLTGTGDVIEPDDGIASIGSGGPYALSAARALLRHSSLPARELALESILFSPSFHPIPRACYRRVRDHDTIAVPHGRRSPRDGENPCTPPALLLLRALCPEAAAHEKSSLSRELFACCGRKRMARTGAYRPQGRAEKREALFVCTVALPVSWDVPCLAPDASPPGERFLSPHDSGRDLPARPEETFSGEGGGGGRPPFFKRDSCLPRRNRPDDDSRTGKTSRPVPDRWRSARPFR